MIHIFTQPDIATTLQVEMVDFPGLVVVENTSQPEDFSPRFGWDFMAPESARQFYVEIAEDCALFVLTVEGDALVFDMPAYNLSTENLAKAVTKVLATVSQVSQTRRLRLLKSRDADDLSNAIARMAVQVP